MIQGPLSRYQNNDLIISVAALGIDLSLIAL